jgi:hypothetical protein
VRTIRVRAQPRRKPLIRARPGYKWVRFVKTRAGDGGFVRSKRVMAEESGLASFGATAGDQNQGGPKQSKRNGGFVRSGRELSSLGQNGRNSGRSPIVGFVRRQERWLRLVRGWGAGTGFVRREDVGFVRRERCQDFPRHAGVRAFVFSKSDEKIIDPPPRGVLH